MRGRADVVDYGRPLQFGISLPPSAQDLTRITDAVAVADLGLDLIGIQDHPYQRRFLDTSALLTFLAARTSRLHLFHDVACLPLRPPAMLANEAASIDIVSNGRFELGLGAGGFWDAIAGMGGPRRTPGQALRALEEAVDVVRLLWSGERGIRYEGAIYTIQGIHSGPLPRHDIEIWLGVYGPRACRLVGGVADGWIPSLGRLPMPELAARQEMIDEAAAASGRDPAAIRRLVNVSGVVTDGASAGHLDGPADQWADELTALVLDFGFDTFIFWPEGDWIDQIGRFTEITEQVRLAVEAQRA